MNCNYKNYINNTKSSADIMIISVDDLRELSKKRDGLITKDFLDDENNVIDNFNTIGTEENILLDGFKLTPEDFSEFVNNGISCIYFVT